MANELRPRCRSTTHTSITKEHASVSEITMKSPVDLDPLSASDGNVTLEDAYATSKIQVRAGAGTIAAALLSVSYGSSTRNDAGDLVCGSRPDEWTIYGDPGRADTIAASVPTEGFVTVIDITHGRAMLRISGSNAASALQKICNLDLSDELTPNGAVFSGSLGGVSCDWVRDDQSGETSFLISCERSFGKFLFIAVADACIEFGLHVPAGWELHGH
ncbi:MAG TPA: hypothetical protein DGF10_03915 [Acidimicrobiaceae bacterium]|nr:hypothetical protein [Acidimicrobiaceae bacterium]